MLSINDLKSGSLILVDGAPYQVLEVAHLHMGRGGSSVQTKIRNIKTGQVLSRNFKPADTFEEAEIEKQPLKFLYHYRGEFVFQDPKDAKNRFPLPEDVIGENKKWLKPNIEIVALFLDEKPLNIQLPIKMDFVVTEAPPGIQGDRSQAGTKTATIETGAV
ncbi:MAG: elongation factor P, partial [Candidatus Colwellbacteria bacterium]|nr:elongation factor P [Candidatus Colwellbacteria bacterium]